MSRPSDYTPELADTICADLAQGMSLRSVCGKEGMPCLSTVFNWLRTKPEFLQQYARAKEESADALTDEMLDIADDGDGDMTQDRHGNLKVNNENVQRARLRIDTRKWLASKLKPKKYGDKIEAALTGPDGGPIQMIGKVVREVVRANADHSDS
jgi:hypothetical protein